MSRLASLALTRPLALPFSTPTHAENGHRRQEPKRPTRIIRAWETLRLALVPVYRIVNSGVMWIRILSDLLLLGMCRVTDCYLAYFHLPMVMMPLIWGCRARVVVIQRDIGDN